MKKEKYGLKIYLKRHKVAITFYILFLLIGAICAGIFTVIMANCITAISSGEFSNGLNLLVVALIVEILKEGGYWIANILYFKYSNIIWREISVDLTKRSFELSSSVFGENKTGSFTQRILDDPEDIIDKLADIVENMTTLLTGAIVIIYILVLNWIIGLCYVVILTFLYFIENKRQKVKKKNLTEMKKATDNSQSLINEIIKSEKDIRSLNLEKELYDTASKNLRINEKAHIKTNSTECHFWSFRSIVLAIFSMIILILGVVLMQKDLFTISLFLIVFTYKSQVESFVWSYGKIYGSITDISVAEMRMFSLYNEEYYETEKFGNKNLDYIEGKIEFKNVEFAYSRVEEQKVKGKKVKEKIKLVQTKNEPIFKDLSFSIEPNTTVAFVGRSGSGKSTIASLIAKLIDADNGQILIDGNDIKDLSKQTIRNNISMINQFPYIFDMSIKENLLLAKKDATDEELWRVLKQACFDEDVKNMPNSIDTNVGETGIKLSGGQRQRLAIARALLKDSRIIIFDESTSNLDNFAQKHIQQSIENLKGQHTVIIIAHRLSTIKNVDKLYFLKNGQINGEGNFDTLFNTNQEFQNMFTIETI